MSLHTKYRPRTFDEVLGQDQVIASLKQAVKGKRAKSFLFTGPAGVGKTTLARILANQFAGGKANASNMEEIDAASKSGADDMRDVVRRTMFRAIGSSPVKTIIIDESHRLSSAAWTILLKPIEEPPAHVFWCLCTTEPGKVPRTITTRCLRYDLKAINEEVIYGLLIDVARMEKIPATEEVIEAVTEAAQGSLRQSLVYLEACAHCQSAAEAKAIMRSAAQTPEAVTLVRFLLSGHGVNWAEAMKHVKALEGIADAESIRIALINYLSVVLMNTKGDDKARELLGLLECFAQPYNASDRMAPLLHSLGLALNMDQQ